MRWLSRLENSRGRSLMNGLRRGVSVDGVHLLEGEVVVGLEEDEGGKGGDVEGEGDGAVGREEGGQMGEGEGEGDCYLVYMIM
jgi:hypothetical protein